MKSFETNTNVEILPHIRFNQAIGKMGEEIGSGFPILITESQKRYSQVFKGFRNGFVLFSHRLEGPLVVTVLAPRRHENIA